MSLILRRRLVKEKTIDRELPSVRVEVRSSLLTLSPHGPWFYAILILAQAGAVALVTGWFGLPFKLALATLFATEGIGCMVVAWFLSAREGDVGFVALAQIRRAQLAGTPNLATAIPEHQADFDAAAQNVPMILILVVCGAVLLAIAFVAALS